MVRPVNEKLSELPALTSLDAAASIPVVQSGVTSLTTPAQVGQLLRQRSAVFCVTDAAYGADPLGVLDPSAAFLAACTAASAVGGTVYVPKGTYGTGSDWSVALPSGVSLEGDGDVSVLRNCHLTCTGTAGAEIPFTAPALKGDTSISIPASALSGAWVRLASCINSQSTDAGVGQLGHDAASASFFAEYQQILIGSVGSATLSGALLWAYSNTPGGDSGSFTTSAARVVTHHANSRIRRIKMVGKGAANNETIYAKFCRDLVIENCTLDANDLTTNLVRFDYCLDSHVRGTTIIGKRTSVPTGGTANPVRLLSCQGCTVDKSSIYYGNQGVDFDVVPNDATYRGGPSINCVVDNCQAFNCATDGFTSHFGCFGSSFVNVRVAGSPRGVRVRDRGATVRGGKLVNGAGTGIGVLIDNAAVVDASIEGVVVDGYQWGIQFIHSIAGYEALEVLLGCGLARIAGNEVRNSADIGIYCSTAPTAATLVGPVIEENRVFASANSAIRISAYNNGTTVRHNRVSQVPSGAAGVRWDSNIARLHVDRNHIFGVDAAGFAYRGPSTSAFMTDAVTFPAGEAAAFLYLGPLFTDAATPFQSIIRDVTAFATPKTHGYGGMLSPIGTSGPTVERQTAGIYLSGSVLLADTRDTSNNLLTHALNIRGSGTPEGAVTAPIGSTFQRTNGGAGTSLYVKESGAGNTGWVAK